MFAVSAFDALPEIESSTPDPFITAALTKFQADCQRDQFGNTRPEPRLCFLAGPAVVLRDSWGEILGRVALSEIL